MSGLGQIVYNHQNRLRHQADSLGSAFALLDQHRIKRLLSESADLLRNQGADPIISGLSDGDEKLGAALRCVWRAEVYGASVPMSPNTALEIAANMFEEWARLTGQTNMVGQYRAAFLEMSPINPSAV